MRIGIRIAPDEVSAVSVASDGTRTSTNRSSGADPGDAVVEVLTTLGGDERVGSVVFDVSGVLAPAADEHVFSVLIEPRRPLEPRRHLWRERALSVSAANVVGGHSALGVELVPLEEAEVRRIAAEVPPNAHLVVTATGSAGNAAHERRTAETLKSLVPLASITESRDFHSDSLLVREYTAVLNALLLSSAERFAAILERTVAAGIGADTRAYVTTNAGGCTPLSRLPITPVHSFRADVAGAMLGAAALTGRADGRLIVARPCDAHSGGIPRSCVTIGEVIDGMPAIMSRVELEDGTSLASNFAHVVPLTDLLLAGAAEPPTTVLVHGAESELALFGLAPAITTTHDLVALGAAVAPLSYWHNSIERISNPPEMTLALRDAERITYANLVASGADSEAVLLRESRVLATVYGQAQVVRVRVRGIAPTPDLHVPGMGLLTVERSSHVS